MNKPARPKTWHTPASPTPDSLDEMFENYFIVARNRGSRHDEVTIQREKTDQYLSLASRDFRFGNDERGIVAHDQVYVYAAIQLIWDGANRRWTLPTRWAEMLTKAGISIPGAPAPRKQKNAA